jgi:hypothetical protein
MSTIKEIQPMNYNAPENISALDVYEQLISYYQKSQKESSLTNCEYGDSAYLGIYF